MTQEKKKKMNDKQKISKMLGMVIWSLLIFCIFILHFRITEIQYDDVVYQNCLADQTLLEFLVGRYKWWSSRVVVEAIMVFLCINRLWLWRIMNTIIIALLGIGAEYSLGLKKIWGRISFICLFFLCIPLSMWNSTGWISSSTNYLWPLTCAFFAVIPISNILLRNYSKKEPFELLFIVPLTIIAANVEQGAGVLAIIYSLFALYLLVVNLNAKKEKNSELQVNMYRIISVVITLVLIGISIFLILHSNGNKARNLYETSRYFPEFENYSFIDKAFLGFLVMSRYFLSNNDGIKIFIVLVIMIIAADAIKYKKVHVTDVLLLLSTAMVCFVKWPLRSLFDGYKLTHFLRPIETVLYNDIVPKYSKHGSMVYIQMLFYCLVWISLLLCLTLKKTANSKERFVYATLTLAAYASGMVIGFSATAYTSGQRTQFFTAVLFLAIGFIKVKKHKIE